jgi:hypothetical protein
MPSMHIDRITLLPELQFREDSRDHQGLANPDRVKEYAEAMERGDTFPPVRVVENGKTRWLVDGFHTLAAYARLGKTAVPVEVVEGDLEAAHREAWKANARRGAEYTLGDKRNKLLDLFRWQEWYEKPIQEVVEFTGISEKHCRQARKDAPDPVFRFSGTVPENQPLMRSDDEPGPGGAEEVPPEEPAKRGRGRPPGGTAARKSRARRRQAASTDNGSQESDGQTVEGEEAEIASEVPVQDEGGAPLPLRAVEAFSQLPEWRAVCRTLDEAAREIGRLGKAPVGAHAHWQSAQSQLRAARKTLWAGRPAHACPYCRGEKDDCQACRGHGFVTASTYEQAKEAGAAT